MRNITVKMSKETLQSALGAAKTKKLAEFDAEVVKKTAVLEKARKKMIDAAKSDLSKEEGIQELFEATRNYLSEKSEKNNRHYNIKRIEDDYDRAIRLLELSSDDTFRVNSESDLGRLIGV